MNLANVNKLPNLSFIKQKHIVNTLKIFNVFGIIPCQIDLQTKKLKSSYNLLFLILLNVTLLVIVHLSTFWWLRHLTITRSNNLVLVITETFLIWILFIGHFAAIIEAIFYQKQYIKLLKILLFIFELSALNLKPIKFTIYPKIHVLITISILSHIIYAISTYINTATTTFTIGDTAFGQT